MTLTDDLPAGVDDYEDDDEDDDKDDGADPRFYGEHFNGFLFCGRINPY